MAYSYPISDEIKKFAQENPRFEASLKMLNDDEYITLNTIILSYPDTLPEGSQVIGVFFAHKANITKNTGVQFKQDYIIKHPDGTFTSVTKTSTPNRHVMPIEKFKKDVGAGKHYGTDKGGFDHWYYSVDELPDILRAEAGEIVASERLGAGDSSDNKPKNEVVARINTADFADKKLEGIPNYDFKLPTNFTKQLTEIVEGVNRMYQNLYGDEIQKMVNNAIQAQQNLIKSLNLIDTKKIIEGITNLTKSFSGFATGLTAHLPDNWSGSKLRGAARLCVQGVPVVFVPRTAIVSKLIKAKDLQSVKRIIAHNKNAPLIIEDCEKALADSDWLPKDMREHIQESIACFKNGQYRAAQSTSIIAFDSLLNVVIDMSAHRKKNKRALAYSHVKTYTSWTDGIDLMEVPLGRMPFYTVLMLPVVGHMLTDFSIGDRTTYVNDANRHASSHTISSKQYKKSNALLTIMAVASICKVTQLNGKYWIQKSAQQYGIS